MMRENDKRKKGRKEKKKRETSLNLSQLPDDLQSNIKGLFLPAVAMNNFVMSSKEIKDSLSDIEAIHVNEGSKGSIYEKYKYVLIACY